jgi:hypothetical protein
VCIRGNINHRIILNLTLVAYYSQIYLLLSPFKFITMKRSLNVLLFFILIAACNSKKNADRAKTGSGVENATVQSDSTNKTVNTQYKWNKTEQDKFLRACQADFAEDFSGNELKDVCNCILTESQKYYPSYSQMKKVINEDFEGKIAMSCLGKYLDESDR